MYTPVADIKKFLAEHPKSPLSCEYSHAMGNRPRGITDYTEYAYEEPPVSGRVYLGSTYHGIAVTSPTASPALPMAATPGDRPTDREFCVDGLVPPRPP